MVPEPWVGRIGHDGGSGVRAALVLEVEVAAVVQPPRDGLRFVARAGAWPDTPPVHRHERSIGAEHRPAPLGATKERDEGASSENADGGALEEPSPADLRRHD